MSCFRKITSKDVRLHLGIFFLVASSLFVYLERRSNQQQHTTPAWSNSGAATNLSNGVLINDEPRRLNSLHLYDAPSSVEMKVDIEAIEVEIAEDIDNMWKSTSVLEFTEFQWDDVDYDLKFRCGTIKCFFVSLSNPTHGYLIWDTSVRDGHSETSSRVPFHKAVIAHDYAKQIKLENIVWQFDTSPPFEIVGVPEDVRKELTKLERFVKAESVVIQPSRTAPAGSITFKCDEIETRLDGIIRNGRNKQRLLKEFAYTIAVTESNPGLIHDYQIMVDPEGRIYHLDLDRALGKNHSIPHHFDIGSSQLKSADGIKRCMETGMCYIEETMVDSEAFIE